MGSFTLVQSSRFSTTDRWSWRITALAFPMRMSMSPICLPSLVNETSRYLNFSYCFSGIPSIRREHFSWFSEQAHDFCFCCSDFHSGHIACIRNLSRACYRPISVESSSTRSSANNLRYIVQSPIFTPPQDSLFSTILSI